MSFPAVIVENHNDDQHGKTDPKVKQWHVYSVNNLQLSNWTQGLLTRREFMPATVNPANYPWPVRPYNLEENLLLPLP